MSLQKIAPFHLLGSPEIIAVLAAFLSLGFACQAGASLAAAWQDIGTPETLSVLGEGAVSDRAGMVRSGGHLFLPLRFGGMAGPVFFSVDPERKTLLVSREFIAQHRLWEYRFEREIHLPQAGGGVVAGDLVYFDVLMVGSRALRDVQAVICDGCQEAAGQSLLDQLDRVDN